MNNATAPMIGSRRGQGSFLCHRSSKGCTCQGNGAEKKVDRRIVKRNERAAFRAEIRRGEF